MLKYYSFRRGNYRGWKSLKPMAWFKVVIFEVGNEFDVCIATVDESICFKSETYADAKAAFSGAEIMLKDVLLTLRSSIDAILEEL
jgi:hypothetical protein